MRPRLHALVHHPLILQQQDKCNDLSVKALQSFEGKVKHALRAYHALLLCTTEINDFDEPYSTLHILKSFVR